MGAGVVGLAIAAELGNVNKKVYVLEQHDTFGKETSSRNSEVIHSGIYYPTNSLKTKLCVEGNRMLYELCENNGIGYRKCGKLIAATDENNIEELEKLLEKGKENGIEGLGILSRQEVKKLEPEVEVKAALFSTSTGIVDSYGLMKYFLSKAKDNGVEVAYNSKVVGIEKVANKYKVTIQYPNEDFSFLTRILINSAGLNSDKIAELAGVDIDKAGYRLHYCKGEYFSIAKHKFIKKLIYPIPEPKSGGHGIHVGFNLEGRLRLGPNARWVDKVDHKIDESQKQDFYNSAKAFLPSLQYEDLEPDFVGIRPKLQSPEEENVKDFVIRNEYDKDLGEMINLIGIESPGLTASPAIAKYVKNMVDEIF
ncbi:MAG: NAD(P)/FAD-dependent oxidoreductase [Candidatus Aenigmarchaeota archaeon]|nr:NAD(P)/FAD-dependent oxidoreductase [Candidatus Aenigmarchaeota archaeon]